jgi:hypothetical protein
VQRNQLLRREALSLLLEQTFQTVQINIPSPRKPQ